MMITATGIGIAHCANANQKKRSNVLDTE